MTMNAKLDAGSGGAHRAGYTSMDRDPAATPDVLGDMEQPWPFPDNSFSEVRAHHILEHIRTEKKVFVMSEIWRVLKPGGIADIEVPEFPSPESVQDPTHVSFWHANSFMYFEDGNRFRDAFANRYSECPVPRFKILLTFREGFIFRIHLQAVK